MSEKKKPLSDIPEIEETEQKTYDSEPVTFEEMQRLQEQFYTDDLQGGLQNIDVPEEEIQRQNEQWDYAKSFIDMKDDKNIPCYKTDDVHVKLTPEQIVVLLQILQNHSLNMQNIEYLKEDVDFTLYEQQIYVHLLHDKVEKVLNEYVRHRPYSPFISGWIKKIGKDEISKDI